VVISPRFGDIFRGNSGKAGLVAAEVDAHVVDQLWRLIESDPRTEVTTDLEARVIRAADVEAPFDIDDYTRWRLLHGLDDVDITLAHDADIRAHESRRPRWKPSTVVPG
jgi:3-isopropylmalate/(R)-2-methylmalate dehydratase small subunit